MKIHHVLATLALAIAPQAQAAADFTGRWLGTGQVVQKSPFTEATTSPCSKIEVIIEHIPNLLTLKNYHAVCGILDSEWGPYPFEIRGTEVFEDGEKTGTFEDDTFLTLSASGGVQYAFNLKLHPATDTEPVKLQTYYGVQNLVGTIVIEGYIPRAVSP